MTPAQAVALLEGAFRTAWASRTVITWDNTVPANAAEWVRVTIRNFNSKLISWSGANKTFERRGYVYVQVYTPVGSGTARNRTLAHDAQTILEGKFFGTGIGTPSAVECMTGLVEEQGNTTDGALSFVSLVKVEFRYTEVRTG